MKTALIQGYFLVCCMICLGQGSNSVQDTTINNLILPADYKTGEYGAIPQYVKAGHGRQTLILIPGLGFDARVFDDFIQANKNSYTIYAITIPGYGKTQAPPMPVNDRGYGNQYWNKGVLEGLVKLIEKEKLQKPVIVGHFVQGTQLALRLAVDYPDKAGKVIIMGGTPKFVAVIGGKAREFPLKNMIAYVDTITAPKWFKKMSRDYFDANNFLPEIYSLDSTKAAVLWKQPALVSLPVMIRYSCEFFASDITLELGKIKCPVMVMRPTFNDNILQAPVNVYVRPQYIDAWDEVAKKNPLIKIKDVPHAATFVWKDRPEEVYREMKDFINTP